MEFGTTAQAFLASLAPIIAFPLVGSLLLFTQGKILDAGTDFLATLCAILAPPVFSHFLATRWNREKEWLRFATAFNWCQWAVPVLGAMLTLFGSLLVTLGLPNNVALIFVIVLLAAYALWIHWFLAYRALQLSKWYAALLVFLVNLGTGLLVAVPQLIQYGIQGSHG